MKNFVKVIALLMAIAIAALCGCTSSAPASSAAPAASSAPSSEASAPESVGLPKLTRISMATGGTTGAMYVIGGGISNVINKTAYNLDVTAEVTNATVENLGLVSRDECQIGLANSDFTQWAYEGTAPFTEKQNVLAIGSMYPSTVHIVASKASGITSVADMKGKKVAVGPLGSGNRLNSEKILNYYGITFDDIKPYEFTNQEMIDALKDNSIDAMILITGSPVAALIDLTMTTDVVFVDLEDKMRDEFTSQFTYFQKLELPTDMYNTEKPVQTIGNMNSMIVNADLDEDVVYYITRAIFENLDEIHKVHVLAADISLESAVQSSIPLHPGAERYYKEVGALK